MSSEASNKCVDLGKACKEANGNREFPPSVEQLRRALGIIYAADGRRRWKVPNITQGNSPKLRFYVKNARVFGSSFSVGACCHLFLRISVP